MEIKTPWGNAPSVSETTGNNRSALSNLIQETGGVEIDGRSGQMNRTPGGEVKPSRDLHSAFPGILGTARSPMGNPINDMSQITENTLVSIGGAQCQVGTAVRMGYLVKHADGTYVEPGAKANQTISVQQGEKAKAQANQAQGKTANFMSPGTNAALRAMKSRVGDNYTDALIQKGLAAALTEPNVSGQTLDGSRLAKEMASAFPGMDEAHSIAFIEMVLNEVDGNAGDYITQHMGVDGNAVMEYAATKLSKSARASVMTGLYHGDKATLHRLVQMYKNGDRV